MIFILIRHGHKSMNPPENPNLSSQGFDQAKKLYKLTNEQILPKPTTCWYSEKVRTKETLAELIHNYNIKHEIKTELNLKEPTETLQQFRSRIQKLLNYCTYQAKEPKNKTQVIYACTHYDWIEEALTLIDSDKNLSSFEYSGWAPAQYLEFEITTEGFWFVKSRGAAHG